MPYEEDWYKVTLYDLTCHPTADWTISFFTEDIEDFQSRWFKLEKDAGRKERFLRSKSGTFETDYYGVKNTDLDIVQKDRATIYNEKEFTLNNIYFQIENATGFRSYLHADEIELQFKWIRFKNIFVRVAKVKVLGLTDHLYIDGKHKFSAAKCWGNPVMERLGDKNFDNDYSQHDSPEIFAENSFVSICYLPCSFFRSERKLLNDMFRFVLSKRELAVLFQNFTSCISAEEVWAFSQVIENYPDSPSKIWHKQTGLAEEPPEVRAEEERYRERIEKGFCIGIKNMFEKMFGSRKNRKGCIMAAE